MNKCVFKLVETKPSEGISVIYNTCDRVCGNNKFCKVHNRMKCIFCGKKAAKQCGHIITLEENTDNIRYHVCTSMICDTCKCDHDEVY